MRCVRITEIRSIGGCYTIAITIETVHNRERRTRLERDDAVQLPTAKQFACPTVIVPQQRQIPSKRWRDRPSARVVGPPAAGRCVGLLRRRRRQPPGRCRRSARRAPGSRRYRARTRRAPSFGRRRSPKRPRTASTNCCGSGWRKRAKSRIIGEGQGQVLLAVHALERLLEQAWRLRFC